MPASKLITSLRLVENVFNQQSRNYGFLIATLQFVTLVCEDACEGVGSLSGHSLEQESGLYDQGLGAAHCIFPAVVT